MNYLFFLAMISVSYAQLPGQGYIPANPRNQTGGQPLPSNWYNPTSIYNPNNQHGSKTGFEYLTPGTPENQAYQFQQQDNMQEMWRRHCPMTLQSLEQNLEDIAYSCNYSNDKIECDDGREYLLVEDKLDLVQLEFSSPDKNLETKNFNSTSGMINLDKCQVELNDIQSRLKEIAAVGCRKMNHFVVCLDNRVFKLENRVVQIPRKTLKIELMKPDFDLPDTLPKVDIK